MTVTDVLAIIGAVTGIVGTIAGLSALCWDFYKWKQAERARLNVTVLPNMSVVETGRRCDVIWVKVSNVGKLTTTLTHLALDNDKPNKFKKLFRFSSKPRQIGGILNTQSHPLPFVLEPGHEWTGLIDQHNPDFQKFTKKNRRVYVSVSHTLAEKAILRPLILADTE